MAKVRLTETAIGAATRRAAETKQRLELADASLPGLRLRLSPSGSRAWVLGIRDREGRARRYPVGDYPAMGVAEAREAARALRQAVRDGADPIEDRRKARRAADAAQAEGATLRAVLDAFARAAGTELRSWPHSRLRIERVFSGLVDRPIATLTLPDLLLAADSYPARASAAFAVRTLRPVLKWAAPRGYAPPALAALAMESKVQRRKRVLDRAELAALLPVLRGSRRPHALALRFMLLTLARREEACAARWADADLAARTWTIGMTKNGEPHTVPLSHQAIELLRTIRAAGIPHKAGGRRKKGEAAAEAPPIPLTPADLIFRTDRGTMLGNWDRETKAIQDASKTAGWHRHDLRRTGATMLGDMGDLPDIIEAALNHTVIRSPLAATYNRSRYRPQVAAALQRLADALDGIEKGAAVVVPLRPAEGATQPDQVRAG